MRIPQTIVCRRHRYAGVGLHALSLAIGREAGNVALVDSAITMAEETARVLAQEGFLNTDNNNPDYRFYVSDIPLKFRMIGERFLSRTMEQIEMVSLG